MGEVAVGFKVEPGRTVVLPLVTVVFSAVVLPALAVTLSDVGVVLSVGILLLSTILLAGTSSGVTLNDVSVLKRKTCLIFAILADLVKLSNSSNDNVRNSNYAARMCLRIKKDYFETIQERLKYPSFILYLAFRFTLHYLDTFTTPSLR